MANADIIQIQSAGAGRDGSGREGLLASLPAHDDDDDDAAGGRVMLIKET